MLQHRNKVSPIFCREASQPQGRPMKKRVKEQTKSEGRFVMKRIGEETIALR